MLPKWFAMPVASFVFVPLLLAQAGDAAKGKEVFKQCAVCHDPASDARKVGPGLKGVFKRAKMSNGKPMNEANVRAALESGGNGMPPYRQMLTATERDAVIAYLKTL
jgi:cytochrome c2